MSDQSNISMTARDELEDEEPLDPQAEKLRRKLVRLLVLSLGFMILSVLTVLGVIIYRTTTMAPAYENVDVDIALPAGARIVGTALDGDRILLTLRTGQDVSLAVVSGETGEILARYGITEERDR